MLPKGMYQIARIEFQKCNFFVLQGGIIHHQTPHCPRKRGTWCWCSTLVTAFTALPPPGEKHSWICLCLSFLPFMLGLCIRIRTCRSEWIFLTYLQSYNDVFHTASYSTGGGGVRATFFNFEGAKINDSLGPPGVRPPAYAPDIPVSGTWSIFFYENIYIEFRSSTWFI